MPPAERPIDSIIVRDRIRTDLGDIEGLAASIADIGLRHRVTITRDNILLAGARRLAAARHLGWTTIEVDIVEDASCS